MVMFTQRMYQGLVYKIENISTTQVTQKKEMVESHECVHKPLGQDELHCSGGGRPLPPGSVS